MDGDFATGRRIMSAMLPLMQVLEQGGEIHSISENGGQSAWAACRCAPTAPETAEQR